MEEDGRCGWNANKEKLLCLVVLPDNLAGRLSKNVGEAFYRAFIVEDRATGAVSARWRFRYRNRDSWFGATPGIGKTKAETVQFFRDGLATILIMAAVGMGVALTDNDIEYFEPPDDEGDASRTIEWMLAKDLITVRISETPRDDV